ncbi:glycosyltransferase family 4 protein [Demequina aestuarii]|uniref:glycosyltransferase family 4 protein n=1 Tax=Demequina aestuarii TaxID=327095 RepID=UPI000783310D|nr:glycosyltransferase family 4 protein [Demequina aestuarii]
MPALRVVVVTHTAELGGAELALLRLLEALPPGAFEMHAVTWGRGALVDRLEAQGVPVTVIDGGGVATVARGDAGRMAAVRALPATVSVATRLRRVLRELDPELVVANSLKAAVLVGMVSRLTRQPWVWHLHDRLAPDYLPTPVARAMGVLAAHGPRLIVANSHATVDTLPARARDRSVVAYPGVHSSLLDMPRREPRGSVVGIVGRLSETKGQREFVAAARIVRQVRPEATFRIVGEAKFGDADYARLLGQAVSAAGLDDALVISGWTDDVPAQMSTFTVVVHASPVPEPFGQVVAEAMALGVPVVATDAGGVPELLDPHGQRTQVADGVWTTPWGVLVRPGDAAALSAGIVTVVADVDSARERARGARARAREELSIGRTAGTVAKAWNACVRQPSREGAAGGPGTASGT